MKLTIDYNKVFEREQERLSRDVFNNDMDSRDASLILENLIQTIYDIESAKYKTDLDTIERLSIRIEKASDEHKTRENTLCSKFWKYCKLEEK